MSTCPSLPAFADAPISATLRGLKVASPQSIMEPAPIAGEQRRFAAGMQKNDLFALLKAPLANMGHESRKRLAAVRRVEQHSGVPRDQANSSSAGGRRHAVAGANEAGVDDHIL